ncbi:3-keto-disaccharide hydrolase [Sunxiuqinia sp. sy24]|uniref:3-keto-disaccharide hydrolase n=1 Tax=Sunxiuqinia sp. sy24 TaxID=3461495 RepID=UPI0040460984
MKSSAILIFVVLVACIGISALCNANDAKSMTEGSQDQIDGFLGQWTFDFGSNAVGWLQVRQEDGYLDADLMWGGGGVFYGLPYVYVAGDVLYLGRNPRKAILGKDTHGNATLTRDYPTWVELKRDGEKITGFYLSPRSSGFGMDSVFIKGIRLPDVPPAPDLKKLKYGKPTQLIETQNDLKGWRLIEDHLANGWSVKDGVLTNNPVQKDGAPPIRYGNLRTEKVFEDFNLKLEVNAPPRSNSGVYLRGMYEVQVADSYERPLNWGGSMGAIFTRILPVVKAEKPAGEWQSLDITLCDRHVTVILNGTKIINNQPVHGATGGAIQSDVFAPGPIYLQGDHTGISFRNLVLTPIIH